MKNLLFLFVFFASLNTTLGQNLDDAFVIGKWKVKKAAALKDADKPETKELLKGFQKATYIFNTDHSFVFETKSDTKMMTQLETMFNNKKWIIDSKKKQIKVGLKKEGYSTIIFNIRFEKETIIFLIEDTEIELQMKKAN